MKKKSEYSNFYPIFFTLVFIFIAIQYPFVTVESFLYDLRVRTDLKATEKSPIIIITLDEESDIFLGEKYPYSYTNHLQLINKIIKDKPAVINYFVQLQNPDTKLEEKSLLKLKNKISAFIKGKGHFRFGTSRDNWGTRLPPKELALLGHSSAILYPDVINFGKDEICRRALLNISGEVSLHLWTANRYRNYTNRNTLRSDSYFGSYYLKEANAIFTLFRFYASPLISDNNVIQIPFHRVVVGNFKKDFFKDKIVLIGPQYTGRMNDFIKTPFNRNKTTHASKLNVHASIIQSLIEDNTVKAVPKTFTHILCFVLAIILSIINSRARPSQGLLTLVYMLVGLIFIGFFAFSLFGVWIHLTHLILTIFIAYYIWVPFKAMAEYQIRYAIEEEAKIIKEVDHLKQNFISLMSHDLKTPVAKISAQTDLLINQYQYEPKQMEYLRSIINSTKELNRFITSILDLTKAESNKFNLKKVSKDINILIENIIKNFKYELSQRKINIDLNLAPLYPIKIDVELIKRVISNLVENAIKYSGHNSRIEISSWDDSSWVYIQVKDSGPGIAQENLKRIFDKFYRVKNDLHHSVKGSGLGLYLVKFFIELHEGKINVDSTLEKGTKFTVKLKNV